MCSTVLRCSLPCLLFRSPSYTFLSSENLICKCLKCCHYYEGVMCGALEISYQAKVKPKASSEIIGRISAKERFVFTTVVSLQNNFNVLQRLNLF